MRDSSTLLTLGGLVTLTVAGIFVGSKVIELDRNVAAALAAALHPPAAMQTLFENVTRPSGRVTTVTTTRGADETLDEFIARHDAAVAKMQATG